MHTRRGSSEITLQGLVTARWVLLALMAATAVLMATRPALVAPVLGWVPTTSTISGFVVTLGVWAGVNLATGRYIAGAARATPTLAGLHLLIDTAALTILLGLTGGATNPFTTLYFVPITLATQVSPRWTWTVAGVSMAGFASLFLLGPLPQGPPGHEHHFAGHLQGMWMSFGLSGLLITYFVHSIALRLSKQRAELVRLREEALEDRHLASLGSLAAGAAHELGTPLGTIQVLVGELPHMDQAERGEAVESIKTELARCKTIVQRMSTPDARISNLGAGQAPWSLQSLADEARQGVDASVEVSLDASADEVRSDQPREALAQIVRELLSNAVDACRKKESAAGVRLQLSARDGRAIVAVIDDGVGMDPALRAAAFDPFLSTKPEGEGMGLGLYIARAQLRQLGGSISVSSRPNAGTQVVVEFPLSSHPPARR